MSGEEKEEEEVEKPNTLEETRREIQRFVTAAADIRVESKTYVNFGMVRVNCKTIKDQLISKAKRLSSKLLEGR